MQINENKGRKGQRKQSTGVLIEKLKGILNNTKRNLEEMLWSFCYYFPLKKMSTVVGTDLS